ncbi:MAG TPA: hypothetical protein VG965_01160 [Patescibacteria group bacterium]|nr:hypothetical protein [Patescibacteria group bacterium]
MAIERDNPQEVQGVLPGSEFEMVAQNLAAKKQIVSFFETVMNEFKDDERDDFYPGTLVATTSDASGIHRTILDFDTGDDDARRVRSVLIWHEGTDGKLTDDVFAITRDFNDDGDEQTETENYRFLKFEAQAPKPLLPHEDDLAPLDYDTVLNRDEFTEELMDALSENFDATFEDGEAVPLIDFLDNIKFIDLDSATDLDDL